MPCITHHCQPRASTAHGVTAFSSKLSVTSSTRPLYECNRLAAAPLQSCNCNCKRTAPHDLLGHAASTHVNEQIEPSKCALSKVQCKMHIGQHRSAGARVKGSCNVHSGECRIVHTSHRPGGHPPQACNIHYAAGHMYLPEVWLSNAAAAIVVQCYPS